LQSYLLARNSLNDLLLNIFLFCETAKTLVTVIIVMVIVFIDRYVQNIEQ